MSWFMKHRSFILLAGVIVLLCLFSMDSALAAKTVSVEEYANSTSGSKDTFSIIQNGTGITGFDNIVQEMGTELVRSARYIVAILIAASGIMVAFGIEDGKRTMWSVILGIGLILNFGSFIYTSYGNYFGNQPAASSSSQDFEFQSIIPKDADITKSEDAAKSAAKKAGDENFEDMLGPKQNPTTTGNGYHFFSTFINSYITHVIEPGAQNIKGILIKLALIITVIDTTVKFAMDLTGGGSELLKKLVMLALKMGFVIFLIENWITGIGLTQSLCNGFEELGFIASGDSSLKGNHLVLAGMSDGSVKAGWTLFSAFTGFITSGLNLFAQPFLILFGLILMLFYLVGMVWLALEMFMAQVEFYTMALLTMMLLPFMMSSHTSFLSNNAIAAMFNCALKVCVIAFLSVVGMKTLGRYFDSFKASIQALDASNFTALLIQFDITVLVLLFLVWKMPQLVQGLLSGQPQFGAGQMVGMVVSGATTVASGAGLVSGAAATVAAKSGGTTVGGQMMSAMSNTFGGIKDMAFGDMKGGYGKFSDGLSSAWSAAGQASKVAGTAVANGVDGYVFDSAPVKAYSKMYATGSGESRGPLSQAEKAAGAVGKNMANKPIDSNGNIISDNAIDAASNDIQVENMRRAFRSVLTSESSGPSSTPHDENHDVTQTDTTHIHKNNVTKYSESVPKENPEPLLTDQFNTNPKP